MGRSIVYCDKCGLLLKEEDFLQGKAFTADNRSTCAGCRPAGVAAAPPPPSKISTSRIPQQPAKKVSSSRVPKQPSQRLPVVPPPAPPSGREAGAKRLYVGLGVGLIAAVGILAMVLGGSKETRRPQEPQPATSVVPVKPPPSESLPPENRRREEAARVACVKAYEVQTTRPVDFAAQWNAFEAAAAAAKGTSYAADAEGQLAKLRRRFEEERAAVETQIQATLAQEQFRVILERWESELKRFDLPEWTRPIHQRIAELKSDFDRRLGMMRDSATEARRRGDEPESRRIRDRVASWGLPGYAEQIDQALAAVVPVKKELPVEPTGATKAVEAYRARWREAVLPAAARDYPEAVKAMEKLAAESKDDAVKKECAEDLENLRLAAAMVQEGGALLPKLAKGQRIAMSYWDAGGGLARIEETILKIDAHRVEIKLGEGSIVVSFGEVATATLADLVKSRPARAAVAACLLDGDAEGAQRFRGEPFPSINEKYADAAKDALQRRSADDREKAARKLFYDAERGYFDHGEVAGAIAAYKALLADHSGTSFVRRNRGAIAFRAEGGLKDFFFTPGDLTVGSTFKLGKLAKIEAAWVSQQDFELAKMKDNFVEFEFSAGTDGEYRCWVLAGGCCQEVLTFYVQGTDLLGPNPESPKEKMPVEPGGNSGIQVKSTYSGFKKTHSQHTGPKNPERFEWIQVGAFKFPTAGPKRVRIISNQKGFGIAGAAAISSRPGAPRDSDFKEFEKWRAETPGASLKQGGIVTGTILREVWRGISGELAHLVNHPDFKADRPAEQGFLTQFEGPTDFADDYGTRIRGYVHPPVTGAYVFGLATDDQGELWLSTDEDPKNKRKIAFVRDHCSPRVFDKYPDEQQSKPVDLKAGRRYYVELLQKDGAGGDHLCVKWKLPTGVEELPIPGNRLSPFIPPKK